MKTATLEAISRDESPSVPMQCGACYYGVFSDHLGGMTCHRYPPHLTATGPLVLKDHRDAPREISLGPHSIIPVGPEGGLYRVVADGFPPVREDDWCGEFR